MVVRERKNAFGQKAKFAFEERVRASCEPSFLLMPMPSVPDFSWYKIFTRLLPHLVQSFGTNFVLPTRLYGTIFFLVQFFWYNFFFWYKNVRVRVRPQEPDLRSVNAFGHFPFAFADTYGRTSRTWWTVASSPERVPPHSMTSLFLKHQPNTFQST